MDKVKTEMWGRVRTFLREFSWVVECLYCFLVYAPSQEGKKELTSHQEILLEMAIDQNVFKDSGYWDYALLMFYDEMVHAYILSGMTSLTDFGWAERAAFLASGALDPEEAETAMDVARSVSQIFIAFSRNLALFAVAAALLVVPDICSILGALGGVLTAFEGAFEEVFGVKL